MENLKMPLSNVQRELLKLFTENVSEEDLLEIKKILVEYRSRKLVEAANKAAEERGYTSETFDNFLKQHMRTPYKSQNEWLKKQGKA